MRLLILIGALVVIALVVVGVYFLATRLRIAEPEAPADPAIKSEKEPTE